MKPLTKENEVPILSKYCIGKGNVGFFKDDVLAALALAKQKIDVLIKKHNKTLDNQYERMEVRSIANQRVSAYLKSKAILDECFQIGQEIGSKKSFNLSKKSSSRLDRASSPVVLKEGKE